MENPTSQAKKKCLQKHLLPELSSLYLWSLHRAVTSHCHRSQ